MLKKSGKVWEKLKKVWQRCKKSVIFFGQKNNFFKYEKSMAKHLRNPAICKYTECLNILNKNYKPKEERNEETGWNGKKL